MEPKIDKEEVYTRAREAVKILAETIGKDALFTFDQIWDYAPSPVPPRQKSSAQLPLKKEGYIVATGAEAMLPCSPAAGLT